MVYGFGNECAFGLLSYIANLLGQLVGCQAGDVGAVDPHFATENAASEMWCEAVDGFEKRGFSAARWPTNQSKLAIGKLQVDATKHWFVFVAESKTEILQANHATDTNMFEVSQGRSSHHETATNSAENASTAKSTAAQRALL